MAEPKRPRKPRAKRAPLTPEEKAASRARSNANLRKDGTRKGEGVGRKSKEFIAYCETLLEETKVQTAIEGILTNPKSKNFAPVLKTVAGYAKGMPIQRVQGGVNVVHWAVALPREIGTAEEWLARHSPAGALPSGAPAAGPVAIAEPAEEA